MADVLYDKYGDRMPHCSDQMTYDCKRIRVETIPFYKNEKGKLLLSFIIFSGVPFSRRFTVFSISRQPASALMIQEKNMSVAEYFKAHHNITLKYPELPCVKVSVAEFN